MRKAQRMRYVISKKDSDVAASLDMQGIVGAMSIPTLEVIKARPGSSVMTVEFAGTLEQLRAIINDGTWGEALNVEDMTHYTMSEEAPEELQE